MGATLPLFVAVPSGMLASAQEALTCSPHLSLVMEGLCAGGHQARRRAAGHLGNLRGDTSLGPIHVYNAKFI